MAGRTKDDFRKLCAHVTLRAPVVGSDPGWHCSVNGVELYGVRAASVKTVHDGATVVRLEFYASVNLEDEPGAES
jgi:hypothetical protein